MRPVYKAPIASFSVGLSIDTVYEPYDFHCPNMATKIEEDIKRPNYWINHCATMRYGKSCQCSVGDDLRKSLGMKVIVKRKAVCKCGSDSMSDGYLSKFYLNEPTCRTCWESISKKRKRDRQRKDDARRRLDKAMKAAKEAGIL